MNEFGYVLNVLGGAKVGYRTKYVFHTNVAAVTRYMTVVRTELDDNKRPVNVTEPKGWKITIPGGSSFLFLDEEHAPDLKEGEEIEITIRGTKHG